MWITIDRFLINLDKVMSMTERVDGVRIDFIDGDELVIKKVDINDITELLGTQYLGKVVAK